MLRVNKYAHSVTTNVKTLRRTVPGSVAVTFLCSGCVHFRKSLVTSVKCLLQYVSFET